MTRRLGILSARTVASINEPGRHADGGNLFLVVDKAGAKRWTFLTRAGGRQREFGLGNIRSVPLAEARQKAAEMRRLIAAGEDPAGLRRRRTVIPTFGSFAEEWLATNEGAWRNEKHRAQWRATLKTYAQPLWDVPIDKIDTHHVLEGLAPIWQVKTETASRVRGRIERILDAARAKGLRSGDNPAQWRGHLKNLLPARQKLTRGHHAAMPFSKLPAFMALLRTSESVSALALEFLILTASRTNEALGARWDEFDLAAGIWTIPATRMKAGRPHRVPLSDRALTIVRSLDAIRSGPYLFPGLRAERPLSQMSLTMLLRRLKCNFTVHGFRSSFRDWCGECTTFPREVAEQALAHVVGDATERAYRRGDALEKRRELMMAWIHFCSGQEPPR
jgi:integrase